MRARVKDVMTTRVVAVGKDATFKEIAALLTEYRVSAFPVLDEDGTVIGVVSEADLLSNQALVAAIGARAAEFSSAVTAAGLMSKPPVVLTPYEPVTSAARLMYNARVKRLPVVGEKGELLGIVSRADVLSVYSRPDEEIRREILENVILNGFFADPDRFEVTVSSGVVTLGGHPETAARGRDIVAETWHVEGVVTVRDRLTYPERAVNPLPEHEAVAGSAPGATAAGTGSRSQSPPASGSRSGRQATRRPRSPEAGCHSRHPASGQLPGSAGLADLDGQLVVPEGQVAADGGRVTLGLRVGPERRRRACGRPR